VRQAQQMADDLRALQLLGIAAEHRDADDVPSHDGQLRDGYALVISTADLYEYAGCDAIQMRRSTGVQYRARVRVNGDSAALRVKMGLMVLGPDCTANVVKANTQAPRPHSLEASGARIELPVSTAWAFYRKDLIGKEPI